MPAVPVHRTGVPQSRQAHALLARGFEILEELLPGLGADLVARRALTDDIQHRVIWWVSALPQVRILAETEALALRAEGSEITGVDVAGPDGTETLDARVVVDASGRSNRGPSWLKAFATDGDRWLVSMLGLNDDVPPAGAGGAATG